MNISEGFIKRPIATSLLMAAIAMFGLVAYQQLPVSDLPNVDFPTLLVTAALPAADLHEGESGGRAEPLPRHHVDDDAAVVARRIRGNAHRPAHLDGERRRAGADPRQPEVRGARRARSAQTGGAPGRHQRGRGGD